jgi:hypothetical protein
VGEENFLQNNHVQCTRNQWVVYFRKINHHCDLLHAFPLCQRQLRLDYFLNNYLYGNPYGQGHENSFVTTCSQHNNDDMLCIPI